VFLLAALPAHLAVQLEVGLPVPLILALYFTNCLEALIGASLVHRFSDAPERFDTFRRAGLFIGAVVLVAPALSGFVDGAAVAFLHGEPYWTVWRTRLFSNTLTALALVPALVSIVRSLPGARAARARWLEAALLVLALVLVGSVVFARPYPGTGQGAWWERSEFVLLLPPLLWAAARFGAAGSSFALLTTSMIALLTATSGGGSTTASLAAHLVRGLQSFLLLTGIPLFALGALMEERRASERMLRDRLLFEELLSRISAGFVLLPSNAMDAAFEGQLRRVGEYSGLASVMLLRAGGEAGLVLVSSWSASGGPAAATPAANSPSELFEHAQRHEDVVVDNPDGSSTLAVPVEVGTHLLGVLVFTGSEAAVRGESATRLRLVAQVFAGALARKEGEDALRAGEEMKSAILASLSGLVAVLDDRGRIIAANETWPEPARTAGVERPLLYGEACRQAAGSGLPDLPEAVEGVQAVLSGRRASFTLEYPSRTAEGDRWFVLSAVPLRRPEGGAVAAHVDVTERRRAEDEARRSREELAHFLRVSTVGELTTSLAHELNQPLTAILANAQAAQFTLASGGDASELPEILDDIVEEDKRAGEVIRRLREMLRKREPAHERLDLNALAADVVRLVAGDAALRNVAIRLDLAQEPLPLSGDRIQIQQVLLNLLLNAMDAMEARPAPERLVVVATARAAEGAVDLSVSDTGTGLDDGAAVRIFEPFYTTKPSGMGMGLSIARSIVEAHGGRIWGRNNAGPGATFMLTLPPAVAEPASKGIS
jgi:signal transduction histidine kinase/integral membrane sensor domain MASE1